MPISDMPNLFIFTAGNESARKHLDASIRRPIESAVVLNAFGTDAKQTLAEIERRAPGFYAWGAKPGTSNESNWDQMSPGDWVLCVYDSVYHYAAQVLGKFRNAKLAESVWNTDASDGKTWEYMYFLTKPREINIPVAQLVPDLNELYFGFTKISEDKVQRIVQTHGSVDRLIQEKFLNPTIDLRSADVLRELYKEFLKGEGTTRIGGTGYLISWTMWRRRTSHPVRR